ncbi:MAG: TonB-dependent receptor plug domain-containing protein [Alphaproteobacteria bacterium]|nr:TonB-dependent receptor plug domain-containing protein [Alphaproteobacteria bacterium]
MRRSLSISTSMAALLCVSAVKAAPVKAAPVKAVPAKAAHAVPATMTGKIEEVMVTADRRSTNLQKTAVAATVLTGAQLANRDVNDVYQLTFIAPSVTVNDFGQGMDFDIRGIGKAEHNIQTTPGVITYRDGVATFPGYFTEEPYYDIASIQVLRGPQGTFAGQNAIGGAVIVTTVNPQIDGGYHGYAQAQYGNYNDVGVQGAVNLPISDTLAARIALYGDARDSFYHFKGPGGGPYTGNPGNLRWGAARLSVLWKPNRDLSVLFKTDLDYLDNGAYPADPYTDRFRFLPLGSSTPNPNYTDLYHITANAPQMAIDQFVRSSVKIDYVTPGGITLQSVSAFQKGNTAYKADLDGTNVKGWTFSDTLDETIYSQELDFISPDTGRVTWVAGAFAQSDEYNFLPPYKGFRAIYVPGVPALEYFKEGRNPQVDLAAFGQISVKLPAGFKLQLGGRYSIFRTKNDFHVIQYGTYIPDSQKLTNYNFSYKAALNWNLDANNFLYAFVATGFKPGGLNVSVSPKSQLPPFGAETVTDYEGGWKSTFLNGHMRTQLDGFYNQYHNFQVTVGSPNYLTLPSLELNNPSTSKIYGLEAETQAAFGDFSFDAGLALMHSSLGTFYSADPRLANKAVCNPVSGPASASCIDLKGHPQTYAPNFTFNVSAQYQFHLADSDTLTPRLNYAHVSPQWATVFDNPALGDRLAARDILGAQLAWTHKDWVVTLYGTNLTDQHYVAAVNTNLDFAGVPRQFGIRVMRAF